MKRLTAKLRLAFNRRKADEEISSSAILLFRNCNNNANMLNCDIGREISC
jgi:hypothetical protein